MKKNSRVINFFVGIIGLVVIAFLFGLLNMDPFGALTGLLSFVLISIICTGGLTLIIWIPVLLILGQIFGTLIMAIYHLFNKNSSVGIKTQDNSSGNVSSNNELAIIGYIVSSHNAGIADNEIIRANLKTGGWNDIDIDNAFKKSVLRT